ncbi:hypothetical protein VMCG_10866 [Cytospora schulzeri]|uniref:Uncharacterized protein n=1 Tax=Cytospora schulzeri TaxID=448051 RepID=A0A423V7X4_9PEZI|nr:hypothetical protein VMCG_10866 [Valsa malicola]
MDAHGGFRHTNVNISTSSNEGFASDDPQLISLGLIRFGSSDEENNFDATDTRWQSTMQAYESSFSLCAKVYRGWTTVNGTLVPGRSLESPLNRTDMGPLYPFNATGEAIFGNRTFVINFLDVGLMRSVLTTIFDSSDGDGPSFMGGLYNSPSLTDTMGRIATGMSYRMLSGPNATQDFGEVLAVQTYIRVQWAWLSLTAVLRRQRSPDSLKGVLVHQQFRDVLPGRLRLHGGHLLVHHLAVLLVPQRDLAVLGVEAGDVAPGLQDGQVTVAHDHGILAGGDDLAGGGGHATQDVLLVEPPAHTPVEEPTSLAPLELVADHSLGLHTSGSVVQVGELRADLAVDGEQELLAIGYLLVDDVQLLLGRVLLLRLGQLLLESAVGWVVTCHGRELLVLAVLDTNNSLGIQDTTARLHISVHLHDRRVDGGIDDDPGSSTEFAVWRNVDKDRLLILDEGVDNERTILENLVVHIALTARESLPVGKDHERQLLTVVEVVDGLSSLERRVGVPHTTGLLADLLNGVRVGRVGRRDVLDRSGLDSDDTHGDTTKASTTNNNGTSPATKGLNERVLIEETGQELVAVLLTADHPSGVVRLTRNRGEDNITVPSVSGRGDRDGVVALVRNEGHPLDDLGDTSHVVLGGHVRHTVTVHDLSTTKLQVGSVDLTTQQVVQGRSTGKDDGLALNLDSTLTKTDKTLNTKAVLLTDNGDNLVSLLTVLNNLLGHDSLLETLLGFVVEVEVLEASLLLVGVVERNLEVGHQLGSYAETSTRVGGQVDTRNAELPGQLSALVEVVIFLRTERTDLVRDIVGNDDEFTAPRVLGRAGIDEPADHTAGVGTGLTRHLGQLVRIVQDKLAEVYAIANWRLLLGQGRCDLDSFGPGVLSGLTEKLREIVHVLCTHKVGLVPLGLQVVLGRVGSRDGQQVHRANLGGATKRVEYPITLLGLALSIHLNLDDESRSVGDDDTQGVRCASDGIRANNADLNLGNTKTPTARSKAVKEALQLELEDRREVDEEVVQVGVVVANDLQGVEDVVDDTVSLRDQVLSRGNLVTKSARSDDSTSEVALVSLVFFGNGFIDMNVLVLRKDRLDLELRQSVKLKLEGKRRLVVSDAVVFLTSEDERNTTDTVSNQITLEQVNDVLDTSQVVGVIAALSETDSDVDHIRELILGITTNWRLPLAAEIRNQTTLLGVAGGESFQSLGQEVFDILQVLARQDDTTSQGILLRFPSKAELGLSNLPKLEVPRDESRVIGLVGVVLNVLEHVGTVGTSNVDLEGRKADPWVLVGEELWQDVEDGDMLHLCLALVKGWESTLDENLSRLERDLGCLTRLEVCQCPQDRSQVLGDVTDAGLVRTVLLEDGKDKVVLAAHTAMGQDGRDNIGHVILVSLTKREDDLLILLPLSREKSLDLGVLLDQVRDDLKLSNLLTLEVDIQDTSQWLKSGLKHGCVVGRDVVIQELLHGSVQGLGGELSVACLGSVNKLAELGVQLLRHAAVKSRELSVPLAVWQLWVPKNLDEVLECRVHDDVVVETLENVDQGAVKLGEPLRRLVTHDHWGTKLGQVAKERLGLLDTARVVEDKYTQDVSSFQCSTGLLDELDHTILLSEEGHVHLHDLHFSENLTSLNVLAVLDRVRDQLSRTGRSELSGIVLLLEQAGLAVDRDTSGTHLFLPVHAVTAAVKENKEATIAESANTDRALGPVDEEVVAVQARPGDGELVAEAFIDEVHGEDSLEYVLGRNLTLVQARLVVSNALLASKMRLGDSTANDSESGVRALSSKLVGDELVQPASGDGVVLEGLRLQELDEILDSGAEVTTNAQFLEGDDHVFPRCLSVLTVGENVTKLGVGETVNTRSGTDREVTPHIGATPEVQVVHDTIGRLETLAGILGGDTASSGVTLGSRSALYLGTGLVLELEVDWRGCPRVNTVQQTNVANAVQGETHGNLELSSGKVHTADHFGGGMLDLETRVQLQEVELVFVVRVKVLHGTSGDVTDELAQSDCCLLHGPESVGLGDGDRRLLDDFLVTSLDRAISAEERNVVAVLICEQLDLQVTRTAGKLHDEDGRARDLASSLLMP